LRHENKTIEEIFDEFTISVNNRVNINSDNNSVDRVYIKRIFISENMIYFHLPILEETNSVIRTFIDKKEKFIRLSFTNDNFEKLNFCNGVHNSMLDNIIEPVLRNGLTIGDSLYSFLCYSNSQLKSYSVWMIGEEQGFNFDTVFSRMGDFSNEKIVSKNASRRALCFSTSKYLKNIENIKTINDDIKESDEHYHCKDVEKGIMKDNYIFTDGIGKISYDLAKEASKITSKENASSFQMRIGGAKGMLSVDKNLPPNTICLRPSMIKFKSLLKCLNIIRSSSYSPGFLNKQTISLLESWDIKKEVFIDLSERVLQKYQNILNLTYSPDDFHMIKTTEFVMNLFQGKIPKLKKNRENLKSNIFILKLSHTLYLSFLTKMKEKMKIHVEDSGSFIGVIDEFNVLKEGQVFLRFNKYNKCHNSGFNQTVTGKVIVTRYPCLYPGDIHVLDAVDSNNEDLNRYVNVIVFSKSGPVPIPYLIGGGDLDGDIYFVSWEQKLIPQREIKMPSIFYWKYALFQDFKVKYN
jgi:hypothetical protein